ncbi:MAG: hypothetical protein P4K98_12975 [Bryobacteraceae bacterium]|nr:hypothetical protein [Bryobacteraceae bacterium]
MAGNQVNRVVETGDAAAPLNLHHALPGKTLSKPRPDDCFSIRFPDGDIGGHSLFKRVFPDSTVVTGRSLSTSAACALQVKRASSSSLRFSQYAAGQID